MNHRQGYLFLKICPIYPNIFSQVNLRHFFGLQKTKDRFGSGAAYGVSEESTVRDP
jgi:hypothetical protein